MTLLTAITRPDFTLIAVDSAAFGASGNPLGREITKAVPLAHAKAVLVLQGSADLLVFLSGASRHFADVDEAELVMPRLLQVAAQTIPGLAATAANAGSRVSLFGYSKARGGMTHATWLSVDGFRTVEHDVHTRAAFVTPVAPAPRKPVKTLEDLEQYVVREQVPHLRKRDATEPIGGPLTLIRLDKHGLRLVFGPDLGMPAAPIVREGEAVHCTLRETAAAIYDPATSFDVLTVSPNTALPDPSIVEQVSGVTFTSGTTSEQDKSILVRSTLSWNAVTGQAIRQSGRIEVQWLESTDALPAGDWPGSTEVEGNATSVVIPGLRAGVHYLFRVRARNTLGVRGMWSNQKLGQVATAPQVQTGGIASEAATQVLTGTAAGPFNGGTGSISGAAVTVSNTFGISVRVIASIQGDYSAANGTGGALVARSNFGIWDSVTSGVAAGNTKIVRAQVPAGETFAVPLNASAEFTVAAGDSLTITAYFSDHASATANGSLSNVRVRCEVVKR